MRTRELHPIRYWLAGVLIAPVFFGAVGVAVAAMSDPATLAFDNANLWWLGAIAPLAGLLVLYGAARRRRALRRFASAQLAPLLCGRVSPARQVTRATLFVLAILLLVCAIIGPRWGIYLEKQKVHGVDIVVALDVSRSMLARDADPNRLERAKRELRQQLTERGAFHGANRLALLAFAGGTSLRLPLTTDHVAFRNKLDQLRVGIVPRGGTAIGKAINAGVDLFAASPQEATKLLLVVTDGENHETDAVEAATAAYKEKGIRVYGISVGDPASTAGAQVPVGENVGAQPLLHNGQLVFSKVDVAGLRAIAEAGNGEYAPIEALSRLVGKIANMKGTELTTEERMRRRPQYQWFLATALMLLIVEAAMSELRSSVVDQPVRLWQQEGVAT